MKKTLWTFDFTVITIGTLISAIGGVAMNFALSLVIFDQTQSAFLTGVFMAISFIPSAILPMLVAPFVDTHCRKHMIVRLDMLSGVLYLMFAIYLQANEFSYLMYMLFSILVSSIGSIYNLAYSSLYPELIPKGFAQKGYSISSVIYPSITALITPIASFVYIRYGIDSICFLEGILLLCAAYFEHLIHYEEHRENKAAKFSFKTYGKEIIEGFTYSKKERGIRSIYSYMAVTNGSGQGVNLMTQVFFQSSSVLTTTMFAFLSTAEMVGRMLGSLFHYFIKIPYKKRYDIALRVYMTFEGLDMLLLFMSYPFMIANRFIAGFLGINSLNIREASTQNYIPSQMRARVNASFSLITSLVLVVTKLVAGYLGEILPYAYVALLFASISLVCVFMIVVRNRTAIKPIFNQDI